jgi:membrane-bound serine protease (ClpP class)
VTRVLRIGAGRRAGFLVLLALGLAVLLAGWLQAANDRTAVLLRVDGPIGPATSEYIERGLAEARERDAELMILVMDTPGGLDTAMRDIIKAILGSPVPVATYVSPSGSGAASAGTYILYASHVAAMAPGTTLGAATPVRIGDAPVPGEERNEDAEAENGEEAAQDDDAEEEAPPPVVGIEEKVIEDAVAYIRGLADLRGRNAEWAERAVREAVSLHAREALELNVIDVVARDIDDLLHQIDGRVVEVPVGEVTLHTEDLAVVAIEPDWRTILLGVITNPNVAYILMMVGIYGIILEFYNPGMLVPGITGAICLLLALYAFQALPINFAGAALMMLGIVLLVAESFAPSFGVLGVGGIIAFVAGSILLMDTDAPGFGISWYLIAGVAVANAGFFMFVLTMATQAFRRRVVSGRESMIGDIGRVVDWSGREGRVRLHGELWNARADESLRPGQQVRVENVDDLMLTVRPEQEAT